MAKPLYESLFESQDAGFVEALRASDDAPRLAKFADRWIADGRAWAHEQMFRYLDRPWDRAGHQPVIKRLFKWAEAQQNDELMAAFATGCDRLVRRVRKQRWEYDWKTRTSWSETVLVAPRDVISPEMKSRDYINPRTGARVPGVVPKPFHTMWTCESTVSTTLRRRSRSRRRARWAVARGRDIPRRRSRTSP